ncbi:MAG: hypothetical protein LBU89_00175 [Fibromonadaceae bacterium]|jgi:hypothetical protein|nr:hypothetical protein [Fibromonadaceae bacterium]
MKKRYLRTVLLLLGIAGIVFYAFFPSEKKVRCVEENFVNFHPYNYSANGDALVEIEPFAFKCRLSDESGNCGIKFSFAENGHKNWNLMDSLVLNLQTDGLEELIVQIQTLTDYDITKPHLKELHLTSAKRYSIAMEHFYTPDYWYEQHSVKNYHNIKKFSAVTGVEIFSGWKNPKDKPLELKIESFCLEGANNTPFVALVIYLAILIITAISVRIR